MFTVDKNFINIKQQHKALVTNYKHKNLGITYKMRLGDLNKYALKEAKAKGYRARTAVHQET